MAKFKIKVKESNNQIQNAISRALKRELDRKMTRAANKLITPVRNIVARSLRAQPEYDALNDGLLAAHFGLPDGKSRIDHIIDTWVSSITVKAKKSYVRNGKVVAAGFQIGSIRRNYPDVLNEAAASITTEKGDRLPWLEWLLNHGDQVIVKDFEIRFDPQYKSRSGMAYMENEPGGTWGVPSQFAGTPQSNFVTRALDEVNDEIRTLMRNAVKSITRG